MKRYLLPSLLTLSALLVGWTVVVTNFYAIPLDQATFSAPTNNQVPVYSSATKTWKAATAPGATVNVSSSGVSQGAFNAFNFSNGIAAGPGGGTTANVSPTYGTAANTIAQGNDNRFNLAPNGTPGALRIGFDTGTAWNSTITASADQVFGVNHANTAVAPFTVSGDLTLASGAFTLASTISAAGPIGDGTHVAQITFDAKGRLTAVSSVAITASGSTIALQNGGSGVTGSPASTLNATNGLTFGTVSAGVSALAPTYGTGSNTFEQGNDTRNNAAPSAAGKLSVDTGSAWHSIAAGAANTLLHGAGAADPTYSAVALADMATQAAKTVLANATNATAVPSAVGGTADQFFQINHANTALGFVTLGGDATLSDGTLTIGSQAVGPTKIAGSATAGQILKTTTASAAPTWADIPIGSVSGGYVTRNGANQLLYAPANSNRYKAFESSSWVEHTIPDAGITVACTSLTASTDYFLYVYDSSGATLDLSTTGTVSQNGILVKSGTTSRTLIARCRTDGSGSILTPAQDVTQNLVCNIYNKRTVCLYRQESTTSWTYNSTTIRAANGGTTTNLVRFVTDGTEYVQARVLAALFASTGNPNDGTAGVGLDSSTVDSSLIHERFTASGSVGTTMCEYIGQPAAGVHTLTWLEHTDGGVNTTTWYGTNGAAADTQSGIVAVIRQ